MKKRSLLAAPYIVWSVGFIILPLIVVLYYALTNSDGGFTFDNIFAIANPIHLSALGQSLLIALGSTVICLVIAYPLAYILSKWKSAKSGTVIMMFILPMWINFMLRVLALQMILSNNGLLNGLLGFFGLPQQHILYTHWAILIGMAYDYLPFMILPIYNAMIRIDRGLVDAAADLGAGKGSIFRRVILPLSMPGVISGIIMVFIPSISEFAIADILGGSKVLLIGNVIEQEFTLTSNWHLGSGLSIVLMIFIFISMAVTNRLDSSQEGVQGIW